MNLPSPDGAAVLGLSSPRWLSSAARRHCCVAPARHLHHPLQATAAASRSASPSNMKSRPPFVRGDVAYVDNVLSADFRFRAHHG